MERIGKMIKCGYYNMDCFDGFDLINDKSIDMILCDLPYGVTKCEWDIRLPLDPLWKQYKRIIKDNGAILLFSQQPFTTDLIQSNRKMFRYEIIWSKTQPSGFFNAHKMPMRYHENICVFYKHLPTYNPIKRRLEDIPQIGRTRCGINGGAYERFTGRTRENSEYKKIVGGTVGVVHNDYYSYTETGERYPSDVVEFDIDIPEDLEDVVKFSNWNGALFGNTDKTVKHPTSKPVALLEYHIKTYTNPGDIVLDNCAGSGSTGIAANNTGRRFIGFEKNKRIFEYGDKRYKAALADQKDRR